jgi:hypothetical protein
VSKQQIRSNDTAAVELTRGQIDPAAKLMTHSVSMSTSGSTFCPKRLGSYCA